LNRDLIRRINELRNQTNTTALELESLKKSYDALAKNIKKG
jgi:hypothetical protein